MSSTTAFRIWLHKILASFQQVLIRRNSECSNRDSPPPDKACVDFFHQSTVTESLLCSSGFLFVWLCIHKVKVINLLCQYSFFFFFSSLQLQLLTRLSQLCKAASLNRDFWEPTGMFPGLRAMAMCLNKQLQLIWWLILFCHCHSPLHAQLLSMIHKLMLQ